MNNENGTVVVPSLVCVGLGISLVVAIGIPHALAEGVLLILWLGERVGSLRKSRLGMSCLAGSSLSYSIIISLLFVNNLQTRTAYVSYLACL